jgi:hypothetical protein
MPVEKLPIFCYYDQQRFKQFGSMDCANWYGIQVPSGKKKQALYPAMGRKHVVSLNQNKLIFDNEPRAVFKTINYFYVVDGTRVFQVDRFYNRKEIGNVSLTGNLWFAFLPVGNLVYGLLTDEKNIFVITENSTTVTMGTVTDTNAPGGSTTGGQPLYVAAFGNRFVVSLKNSPDYYLTRINLFADGGDLSNCFTINGSPLFNRASGVIGQMAVLHQQLYIFCDYTTDIWANILTQITVAGVTREFPWKLNSSYNWDYGIADPFSLDTDFGRMVWLARNSNGLVSFMASTGQQPEDISSQAINVLLENDANTSNLSPFLAETSEGFLYQYENTIFYRVAAGAFIETQDLDITTHANCLEFNFETKTWHRCIELDGERNRIQKHVYFDGKHLVTLSGDPAMYEMAGNIYYNEIRNKGTDPQAANAFIKNPMRYELVTEQIIHEDYSEFVDDYVEIDFVFGDQSFYKSNAPFLDTVFIVAENSTPTNPIFLVTEDGKFIIKEGTNNPSIDDTFYNTLFKPHIELYYSNDGGVTFTTADLREFSPLGQYRWRMRWYELGASRNRCYKLVCVSSAPIVILGGVRNTRRVSGGAN